LAMAGANGAKSEKPIAVKMLRRDVSI
jgi:hypothetical protein